MRERKQIYVEAPRLSSSIPTEHPACTIKCTHMESNGMAIIIDIYIERKSKSTTMPATEYVYHQCQITQVSILTPSLLLWQLMRNLALPFFGLGKCDVLSCFPLSKSHGLFLFCCCYK